MGVRHRVRVEAGGDQAGIVRHVDHQVRADLVGDGAEAGEVDLHLTDDAAHEGRKVWKIRFRAHSSGILQKMSGVKIDDEFVFLTEPDSLCTLSVSKKIREGKRKRRVDVEYLGGTGQLRIRETDEAPTPPVQRKDETKDGVPACVHDPFSAIYLFRKSPLEPKYGQTFTMAHDDSIKEIRTHVDRQETIKVPAGQFPAWRVKTASMMGGLFKDGGQFLLWLSADERKLPLQFEVKVSLGKVFGRLKAVEN
mgnify:CR=1 FL=1